MFKHTTQKEFEKLGIQNNQEITEDYLNKANIQLKKEVDDAHNFISIFAGVDGLTPIEYRAETEYQKNEIVVYNNQNYISLKKTQGNLPTNTKYWKIFDEYSRSAYIQKLSNFLGKNNQTEYDPNSLDSEESIVDYHPATVKFVQERIKYHLKNSVIQETKRLDGYSASRFALQSNIEETKKNFQKLTGNRLVPYTIPFSTDDMNVITKSSNFEDILPLTAFDTLYEELQTRIEIRFGTNQNKVVGFNAYTEDDTRIIELNILGPFKGFGCEANDWTCGEIFFKITRDSNVLSCLIESSCSRQITPYDYANLTNKSDYVVYVLVDRKQSKVPVFFQNSDIFVGVKNVIFTYPNRDIIVNPYCICNVDGSNTTWSQGCTNHLTDAAYTSCQTNITYNCPANLNGIQ